MLMPVDAGPANVKFVKVLAPDTVDAPLIVTLLNVYPSPAKLPEQEMEADELLNVRLLPESEKPVQVNVEEFKVTVLAVAPEDANPAHVIL